ncbi:hypothetical protein FNV43_RR13912 [Rhamnella rubrinervis]|uniref:Exostosin GT47 domain-containing protein n=1 Tax=Rhamnella rubrinervis TaxID=2594499 RepID=A0A8K0H208_9ROSA|nr:hypothetical protein FNV43_RR13912 [Rhamnella rubrinervis]
MRLPSSASSTIILALINVIALLVIPLVYFSQPNSSSWTSSSWKLDVATTTDSSSYSSSTTSNYASSCSATNTSCYNSSQLLPHEHQQSPEAEAEAEAPTEVSSTFLLDHISPSPASSQIAVEVEAEKEHSSSNTSTSRRRVKSKLHKLEISLGKARSSIREAANLLPNNNSTSAKFHAQDPDYVPQGPIYRNSNAFHRSYLEMEKLMKIYVYEEGEPPLFHEGPCKSIYSTEGSFIHEMEKGKLFRTRDPDKALVYFLPFSVVKMVRYLYVPDSHNVDGIGHAVTDYLNLISNKYPFWNRSLGADHFMLSCHDWGPRTTSFVPRLFHNSIRVLCNANTSEGFNPSKDVSLPEINLRTGEVSSLGGPSPSTRTILGFFAGQLHGHIRYLLLQQWKNKDKELQVYETLPRGVSYESMMKKSKFCLCPSGYEVASPRVVEAIYAECVPVLISDGYIPPFSDVLKWKSFSVIIKVNDIPNIKDILMGISQRQYLRLHRRVKQVQRHFVVNNPPKRFDIFHMLLHSIWLRRLNIRIEDL